MKKLVLSILLFFLVLPIAYAFNLYDWLRSSSIFDWFNSLFHKKPIVRDKPTEYNIYCDGIDECVIKHPGIIDSEYSPLESSTSMLPTIQPNSIMLVTEEIGELSVGDIIHFKVGDVERGHRVIKIEDDCYYTKGDNAWSGDNICVRRENIKNKIIGVLW